MKIVKLMTKNINVSKIKFHISLPFWLSLSRYLGPLYSRLCSCIGLWLPCAARLANATAWVGQRDARRAGLGTPCPAITQQPPKARDGNRCASNVWRLVSKRIAHAALSRQQLRQQQRQRRLQRPIQQTVQHQRHRSSQTRTVKHQQTPQ